MSDNEQAKQQVEPGQPHEPTVSSAETEVSDEELDEVAGGAAQKEYYKVTMSDVIISSY